MVLAELGLKCTGDLAGTLRGKPTHDCEIALILEKMRAVMGRDHPASGRVNELAPPAFPSDDKLVNASLLQR